MFTAPGMNTHYPRRHLTVRAQITESSLRGDSCERLRCSPAARSSQDEARRRNLAVILFSCCGVFRCRPSERSESNTRRDVYRVSHIATSKRNGCMSRRVMSRRTLSQALQPVLPSGLIPALHDRPVARSHLNYDSLLYHWHAH
jgi:hypothetical protein